MIIRLAQIPAILDKFSSPDLEKKEEEGKVE